MYTLFIFARIILAVYFLMMAMNHITKRRMLTQYASSRGVPAAGVGVLVGGLALLFGGLGLLLGVYTAWAIWILAIFLVVVAFSVHHFWTDADSQKKMVEMQNFMKNIALAAALVMLLAVATPWPFSLL